MTNSLNTPINAFQHKRHKQDKQLIIQFIRKEIEKGAGITIIELIKQYPEDRLFYEGLKYITTTKKAICIALSIPIEAGCRYKRELEKNGKLVQSVDEEICPYTKHLARLLSTNPDEFERLGQSKSIQLKLL